MPLQPVLVGGAWRPAADPVSHFRAVNPAGKAPLADAYPVSSRAEMSEALTAAQAACCELRNLAAETRPERLASFLEAFAVNIEARAAALVELAHDETALPKEPRLRTLELPRTTDQLRQAAAAVRERSWCQATIDTRRGIRSLHAPLDGPVAVFGPNNFPFAFNSTAGGDFAAAIAAGNPVLAKANTGHPGTSRLLAEAAFEAVLASGLPRAMVQLLYRLRPEDGLALVAHPLVGATGFTGSRSSGLRLKDAADRAGKPIYLEMSSINPVFILPGALEERLDAIATELFTSCSLGTGQFCTKPGLVIVPDGSPGEALVQALASRFEAPPGILLGADGVHGVTACVKTLRQNGATLVCGGTEVEGPAYRVSNALLRIRGDGFLRNPQELQTEAFGVVCLVVLARDGAQMVEIAQRLEGSLTGCIYSHTQGADDPAYASIEPRLRGRVGRLLNDKMPTGVAVSPAMNHGGPFPATGHPGFTAVGVPAAMLRFTALHAYDNVRPQRLPPELRDPNPTGRMWRLIDGTWSQADVPTAACGEAAPRR
jgi:NADP-dependent aldehyde dehydrogenase